MAPRKGFTFQVFRTSSRRDSEDSPCEGASRSHWIEKNCVPAKKLQGVRHEGQATWWYGEGENHRVEGDQICRDVTNSIWVIDIPDLETLIEFVQDHRSVVLSSQGLLCDLYPELEIYDDYRE